MNRLIKRYILKAQRDKDNDEVNEGEFWSVRISWSLNYEIMRINLVALTVPQVSWKKSNRTSPVFAMSCWKEETTTWKHWQSSSGNWGKSYMSGRKTVRIFRVIPTMQKMFSTLGFLPFLNMYQCTAPVFFSHMLVQMKLRCIDAHVKATFASTLKRFRCLSGRLIKQDQQMKACWMCLWPWSWLWSTGKEITSSFNVTLKFITTAPAWILYRALTF